MSDVTSDIVKAKAAVKQKLKQLRGQKFETERQIRQELAPLIKPLEKIAGTPPTPVAGISTQSVTTQTTPSSTPVEGISTQSDKASTKTQTVLPELTDIGIQKDISIEESELYRARENITDTTYGPKYNKDTNTFTLGNLSYRTDLHNIYIGDDSFPRTDGLIELIERGKVDKTIVSVDDYPVYSKILDLTSAHRRYHDPNEQRNGTATYKYLKVIKPLTDPKVKIPIVDEPPEEIDPPLPHKRPRKGEGLINCQQPNPPVKIQSSDPNVLCDRLRLLMSSTAAGHTGHSAEMKSIVDELRRTGYIL